MPSQSLAFRVLIASPSDVVKERAIARDVIEDWNAVNSKRHNKVLLPIGWETHSFPEMGGHPQEILNKQLLGDADFLVAIFWTRIGTPTSLNASGTVEEIQKHQRTGRPTFIYFSDAVAPPSMIDSDQLNGLREFRDWCQSNSLYHTFKDAEEFRSKFASHLGQLMNSDLGASMRASGAATEMIPDVPIRIIATTAVNDSEARRLKDKLTPIEARVLKAAALDRTGHLLHRRYIGGESLTANNFNFLAGTNPRQTAQYEEGVEHLQNLGLIRADNRDANGAIYRVTALGFRVSDLYEIEIG